MPELMQLAKHTAVCHIYGTGREAAVLGEQERDQLGDFFWFRASVENIVVWQFKPESFIEFFHHWGLNEATVGARQ